MAAFMGDTQDNFIGYALEEGRSDSYQRGDQHTWRVTLDESNHGRAKDDFDSAS